MDYAPVYTHYSYENGVKCRNGYIIVPDKGANTVAVNFNRGKLTRISSIGYRAVLSGNNQRLILTLEGRPLAGVTPSYFFPIYQPSLTDFMPYVLGSVGVMDHFDISYSSDASNYVVSPFELVTMYDLICTLEILEGDNDSNWRDIVIHFKEVEGDFNGDKVSQDWTA